jgi:hypothetical protein
MTPIKLNINLRRIDQSLCKKTESGSYADFVLWPHKEQQDSRNGSTHIVCQSLSKAKREAGLKGPIVGNATIPQDEDSHDRPPVRQTENNATRTNLDDDIPF